MQKWASFVRDDFIVQCQTFPTFEQSRYPRTLSGGARCKYIPYISFRWNCLREFVFRFGLGVIVSHVYSFMAAALYVFNYCFNLLSRFLVGAFPCDRESKAVD